jgi:hypothetical protein
MRSVPFNKTETTVTFIQMEFWLSQKLHIETGLALNTTSYTLANVFAGTQANKEPILLDQCGLRDLACLINDNGKNLLCFG